MSKLSKIFRDTPVLSGIYWELYQYVIWKRNRAAKPKIERMAKEASVILDNMNVSASHVFFLGVPIHNNMGDQAQKYCIERWIEQNYKGKEIVELPTWPFYDKVFRKKFKTQVKAGDIIVIQSGYCTTSWHYDHYMHRFVVKTFKDTPILIMPQTVNYQRKRDGFKTGRIYRKNQHLLFLARDKKSFEYAQRYFHGTEIQLYPDIVTSLIGDFGFPVSKERDGVLICVRNDGEKLYGNDVINDLAQRFREIGIACDINDTNSDLPLDELQEKFADELRKTLSFFACHNVVITDRYHGTIFSMISNTPVIVLATNDHKVKTGTEWFKGIYDGAYRNAETLDEAYAMAKEILEKGEKVNNTPFFKKEYYDKLRTYFDCI